MIGRVDRELVFVNEGAASRRKIVWKEDERMCDHRIKMSRYQGPGTDCLILDPNQNQELLAGKKVELICRRSLGIGGDSVLYGPILENGKARMKIFQPECASKEAGEGKIGAFANYLVDACYFAGEPQDGVQVGLLDVSLEDMEFQTDWRACGKRNREIQFVEDIYLDESFFVS